MNVKCEPHDNNPMVSYFFLLLFYSLSSFYLLNKNCRNDTSCQWKHLHSNRYAYHNSLDPSLVTIHVMLMKRLNIKYIQINHIHPQRIWYAEYGIWLTFYVVYMALQLIRWQTSLSPRNQNQRRTSKTHTHTNWTQKKICENVHGKRCHFPPDDDIIFSLFAPFQIDFQNENENSKSKFIVVKTHWIWWFGWLDICGWRIIITIYFYAL